MERLSLRRSHLQESGPGMRECGINMPKMPKSMLMDPATGAALQTLEGHGNWVSTVVFSQDGKLLASVSRDDTVRLWDPATGATLQTLEGRTGWVGAATITRDGK